MRLQKQGPSRYDAPSFTCRCSVTRKVGCDFTSCSREPFARPLFERRFYFFDLDFVFVMPLLNSSEGTKMAHPSDKLLQRPLYGKEYLSSINVHMLTCRSIRSSARATVYAAVKGRISRRAPIATTIIHRYCRKG